ncbi:hypothetical protein MRB53_018182 [Persea americana]|uniref:Uncharacterized protein n=1 Tax=Persea americana TaxID=3435 RepID=A0ACC2M7R6_PERAE|nr:hypothetical protein MRB53_018182 [Persea americana]
MRSVEALSTRSNGDQYEKGLEDNSSMEVLELMEASEGEMEMSEGRRGRGVKIDEENIVRLDDNHMDSE